MRYQLELEPIGRISGSSLLTPEERQHYLELKTDKRRREWLAGRIAAKRLIRKALEGAGVLIDDNEIPIQRSENGVPFAFFSAHYWPLSISHSGEWAAAAMPEDIQNALVGIDIEKIEERDPAWFDIAFDPSEQPESLDIGEQTRYWTMKEAVFKLLGIGLSTDLRDVRFPANTRRMELHGKARKVWETMGSPEIAFDFPSKCDGYAVSVAFATCSQRETQEVMNG